MKHSVSLAVLALLALNAGGVAAAPIGYAQANLVSSVPGLALNIDPNLKNPWGMSYSPRPRSGSRIRPRISLRSTILPVCRRRWW